MTDLEHWGTIEKWSYPDDGYGDCEDYVLLMGDCREIKQWLTLEEAIAELKALGLDEGKVRAWLSRMALNPKVSVEFLLLFPRPPFSGSR
jgi:hypothetical protein